MGEMDSASVACAMVPFQRLTGRQGGCLRAPRLIKPILPRQQRKLKREALCSAVSCQCWRRDRRSSQVPTAMTTHEMTSGTSQTARGKSSKASTA